MIDRQVQVRQLVQRPAIIVDRDFVPLLDDTAVVATCIGPDRQAGNLARQTQQQRPRLLGLTAGGHSPLQNLEAVAGYRIDQRLVAFASGRLEPGSGGAAGRVRPHCQRGKLLG